MFVAIIYNAHAQTNPPWWYDFGTMTGSFTTGNTVSTTFLPQPPTGGGEDRIRIGSGGGAFYLENPGIEGLGDETELRIVAPTGASINKFSIYDYTPGKTFTIRFEVRFGGGSSGTWYFFNGDGTTYSDNNAFSGTQVFTGLRWTLGASDAITTSYRSGANWVTITGTPFTQNVNYIVEIYGNNSTITETYNFNGTQSLSPNTFDLWVNGTLVGDDLAKALLSNDANIDSWMFYGENSTGNVANIYLDQIHYSNKIEQIRLPVVISSFVGYFISNNSVKLEWETISEINNFGFYVEKLNPITNLFTTIEESFQPGAGNSFQPKQYTWTDENATESNLQYRLKQLDNNGLESYFGPIMLNPNSAENPEVIPVEFKLNQNYPNPFNPQTSITFTVANSGFTTLKVYNILGNEISTLFNSIAEAGKKYNVEFNASSLPSGIYFYKLSNSGEIQTRKMVLLK